MVGFFAIKQIKTPKKTFLFCFSTDYDDGLLSLNDEGTCDACCDYFVGAKNNEGLPCRHVNDFFFFLCVCVGVCDDLVFTLCLLSMCPKKKC